MRKNRKGKERADQGSYFVDLETKELVGIGITDEKISDCKIFGVMKKDAERKFLFYNMF